MPVATGQLQLNVSQPEETCAGWIPEPPPRTLASLLPISKAHTELDPENRLHGKRENFFLPPCWPLLLCVLFHSLDLERAEEVLEGFNACLHSETLIS